MEDGSITNDQITASSFNTRYDRYPWNGRLNKVEGFWSTSVSSPPPWIQVVFLSAVTFTALQVQGGTDEDGDWSAWVTRIQIQTGNSEDTLSFIKDDFSQPVVSLL